MHHGLESHGSAGAMPVGRASYSGSFGFTWDGEHHGQVSSDPALAASVASAFAQQWFSPPLPFSAKAII